MKNSRVGRKTPNKQAKSNLKAPTAHPKYVDNVGAALESGIAEGPWGDPLNRSINDQL